MPKKGENIRKRKDGRWEGRYIKGRKENGNIIYGYVYGKSYREVKEKRLLQSFKNDECKQPEVEEIKFSEVLQLWFDANKIKYKGATEMRYQYLIEKHIIPEFGNVYLSQISSTKINMYLNKKLKSGRLDGTGGLSPAYVRSIMLIINSAISFAVREQLCAPLKSPIFKPTMTKKELPILSISEQKILENHLTEDMNFTKLAIYLSLYSGLRIGEICALKWEDVDFDNQIISVRHTVARVRSNNGNTRLIIDQPKTIASMREIPISNQLSMCMMEMYAKSTSDFVISETKDFVKPRTLNYRYHRLLKEAGLNQINFHALRHTFATRCVEAGVDVKSLSEILGHSNANITLNTYVHSSIELKRKQIEKLSCYSAMS